MTQTRVPAKFGVLMQLSESARDRVALVIWFIVLASVLSGNGGGHSILLSAGIMSLLSGAYSTFWLCDRQGYEPFVHGVPYALTFLGTMLLYFAPDFHGSFIAGLAFLTVIAIMHAMVMRNVRRECLETDEVVVSASA